RELWIMGPGVKTYLADISATIDRKIEALMCHQSQVGDNAEEIAGFVRKYCAEAGAPAGFDFAEGFEVIHQGPGFHAGEQDEPDLDLAKAPVSPPSAPVRRPPQEEA
ncbi:MAG TPA: hypothetical protein VEV82_08065, partial [Actinomycetota bacterium]|nr:hypothetical protein [Actinomycetota bacterium]